MKFCQNCGTRLKLKKTKIDEQLMLTIQCERCGFSVPAEEPITKPEAEPPEDQIKIVGDEVDIKTMPTVEEECPKCGNKEAFWWLLQTRSGDEATTQFYRCTKCNHTWREYA